MNIVANNVASKLFVAFVAVAMLFTLTTPAKAATAEELQQMINDLLAQVAALQGQAGQGGQSTASGICPYTWTRSLKTGTTGADVMKLQQFLNADVETRVSASGVGSVGMETEYFGPATAAAVSKFQVKYRSDVLSPSGLVNPTGFFGPGSMAKANMICNSQTSTGDDSSDDTSDDSSDDSSDDTTSGDLSGEASLYNQEIDSASDDSIEENSTDAEIATTKIEFQDGDAMITRLDIELGGVEKVWNIYDEVALMVDGKEIARMDASNKADYINTSGNTGTLRFSGLDLVAMEDEEVEVSIVASVGSVDSGDQGTYTVAVDSMRFVDATDVTDTVNSGEEFGTTVNVTIGAAGADDEIIVKTSSEDPDGTTLEVKDDAKSSWYNVFAFDLDTKDSTNDIELTTVVVHVAVSSSTYATLVDDAELVIDGVTIDSVSASSTLTSTDLTFDVDGDVTIDAGDRVTALLNLKFKALALGNEGVTVTGSVTAANRALIDATGGDDLATSQLSGAATGDAMTLRTAGVNVEAGDMSAVVTTPDSNLNDYGTFSIELDVTAFNQDVYISTNPATSMGYVLEDSTGSTSIAGSRSVVITSTGDEVGSAFEITEGSTETITLTVTYTPGVANTASRLNLNTLTFGSTSGTPTGQSWTASPDESYRTAVKTMVN